MEVVNPDSGIFKCEPGETVTVSFRSHNTTPLVTYRVDEEHPRAAPGDSFSFTPENPLTILRVFFDFTGNGGSYDVRLSGSEGGSFPDPPPVRESHGIPQVRRYAFTR